MLVAVVPLLVAVVGALVYAFASNGKLAEVGRIAFFCGLFWTLYVLLGVHVLLG